MTWLRTIGRCLSRYGQREDGNATIEFVLLFPALMSMFFMVFETGVMMTRGVMLDRGVDISIREVRLGTLTPMTHDGLKAKICDSAVIIPDCDRTLLIELIPVSKTTWQPLNRSAKCYDRAKDMKPDLEWDAGSKNEMMVVRVCALFDPFFPTTGLAAQMKLNDGAYALIATSAFVNEP